MTATKLKERIDEICTHVTFELNGRSCGIDPISHSHYDMWYGDVQYIAHNINDVMEVKLFGGKSLNEIADTLMYIDY